MLVEMSLHQQCYVVFSGPPKGGHCTCVGQRGPALKQYLIIQWSYALDQALRKIVYPGVLSGHAYSLA